MIFKIQLMKKHIYHYILVLIPLLNSCFSTQNQGGNAGGSTTRRPPVNRTAADYTEITKVELTDRYTKVFITHTNTQQPRYDNRGNRTNTDSQIRIKRETRLLGLNGSRAFRLLKADGIPIDPQYISSRYGQRTDFILYFERLDPGIETFDLFECNDYDNMVCWNFYDVYVKNPGLKNEPVITKSEPTLPGETEVKPTQKPQNFTKEITVRGAVRDSKTMKPISAKIDYKLLISGTDVDSIFSFPNSGEYKIRLQSNQIYAYTASAPGYLVFSDNIDLTKSPEGQVITKDILLVPFTIGEKISLKNIYFDPAKYELLPASFAELDRLVSLMKRTPTLEIKLEGHTDVIGDKAANLTLSKNRVDEVKKYLVSKGVADKRIATEGFGATKPIVEKGTDEERKVNRRVEFVITKN